MNHRRLPSHATRAAPADRASRPALPHRLAVPAALVTLALGACTFSSTDDSIDYKSGRESAPSRTLAVPPDLTQLARENRYALPNGVVSAAAAAAAASAPPGTPSIAPNTVSDVRVVRDGQARWLFTTRTPEAVWPQVRDFWVGLGFAIAEENAAAGTLETDWAEDRAKFPHDIVRQTVGKVFEGIYDTGLRDRFRTRIERVEGGTEIYVSHRGLEEVLTGNDKDSSVWQQRNSDPQLEAEMLARLMARLGTPLDSARPAVAAATPDLPTRARALENNTAIEVDEPFERAWRRVGLALDRGGFTVEDRDRAGGLYYVRYLPPGADEEPGFFARLFGGGNAPAPTRYRIAVTAAGEKTRVAVLSLAGQPETGENAQRIVGQLVTQLR